MAHNIWAGTWTYRSLLNDPDGSVDFDKLEFGEGTIVINDDPAEELGRSVVRAGHSICMARAVTAQPRRFVSKAKAW